MAQGSQPRPTETEVYLGRRVSGIVQRWLELVKAPVPVVLPVIEDRGLAAWG